MHFDNKIDKYYLGKYGNYYEVNGKMVFLNRIEHPLDIITSRNSLLDVVLQLVEDRNNPF